MLPSLRSSQREATQGSYTGQGRARHPVFELIVLLAFFTYVVFAKSRWR